MLLAPVFCLLASCVSDKPADTRPVDVKEAQSQMVPVVIAHRGASGTLPEHTLPAYQLAIEQGADFIEPDLVMTKDGVLVVRHDPWLSDSTDITNHPEFADRKTTVVSPDGQSITDWFVWDFTLSEIRTLRARQARAGRDNSHDGEYEIPTFAEVLNLFPAGPVGVYPETKWPGHHAQRGLDLGKALVSALGAPMDGRFSELHPVRIQSFEAEILKQLNKTTDFRLVQLVYPEGYKPDGKPSYDLEEIAIYADGVGPYKSLVMDPVTGQSTGYALKARALGLEVHPWTFRDDDKPTQFESPEDEIQAVLDAGATGFFTDFPETGVRAVRSWLEDQNN